MEQAGINSVFLIENKDILITYDDEGSVDTIDGDGNVVEIPADFPINLEIKESRDSRGKISYLYELDFMELSADTINIIRRSIYGFIPALALNTGEFKILTTPLIYDNSKQDNNQSASYSTKIINFVKTSNKLGLFNNNFLQWILDSGYWEDLAFWVDSRFWID